MYLALAGDLVGVLRGTSKVQGSRHNVHPFQKAVYEYLGFQIFAGLLF